VRQGMSEEIKNPEKSPFRVCNNSSCLRKSFESDKKEPLTKKTPIIKGKNYGELDARGDKEAWDKAKSIIQTSFKENEI
jgi:hypothetical protein